ncbi:ABC transporter substrate-binding protein [Propylenella binzhouense]|uniref:ABC transporter substrate-binding protein n=1 Tax=Propylenella binzhouense TaxID=2555902 RepID=A0A964WSK8_9HYPH|nr:ABC transporter substrate-binding protein [Propylenella binzhouense]MYZ46910.1 ABC transporter substrate-binding protein [Propylenella binzhouense]
MARCADGTHAARRFLAVAGAALSLSLGFSSSQALAFESPQDGVYEDRIDWGVTGDMSGPAAGSQHPWVKGFQSRMHLVNEKGGINGRQINVLAEDTRYDAPSERIAYEKFASQTPVLGMSGMGNSSAQTALVPMINRLKVPVVGTYTTAKASVEPTNPLIYGGFCGFKQMAQVGVGHFANSLKLDKPKVATVHLDVASGVEFNGYMDEAVKKLGGTNVSIPIKVVAADATPQVLALLDAKPDFVAIHGVATTSLLVLKAMQQYGVDVPSFAITYLGTPSVYQSVGEAAGKNYHFVSCFTPASAASPEAAADLIAQAEKDGHGALQDDINFVAGWVVAGLVAEAITEAGEEPTREKLVEILNDGFELPASGLSSKLVYTSKDHEGLKVLQPIGYDYATKKFKSFGDYADFEQYVN